MWGTELKISQLMSNFSSFHHPHILIIALHYYEILYVFILFYFISRERRPPPRGKYPKKYSRSLARKELIITKNVTHISNNLITEKWNIWSITILSDFIDKHLMKWDENIVCGKNNIVALKIIHKKSQLCLIINKIFFPWDFKCIFFIKST